MLELKIKTGRKHIPIFDLPTVMGRREAAREVGDQIETLLAFIDDLDGDPDLEDSGDEHDSAWVEWSTMQGSQKAGANLLAGHEDDEDDDPAEDGDIDCCAARDDIGTDVPEHGQIGFHGDPSISCEDCELNGDETDGVGAEDEKCAWFAGMGNGPGCIIGDPDAEHDGTENEEYV